MLVTHQGIREQGTITPTSFTLTGIPELMLLGGHTHRLHKEQMIRGILYTQANYWEPVLVKNLVSTLNKRLTTKKSDVIPWTPGAADPVKLLEMLKPDIDKTEAFLNESGRNPDQIDGLTSPKKETLLSTFSAPQSPRQLNHAAAMWMPSVACSMTAFS